MLPPVCLHIVVEIFYHFFFFLGSRWSQCNCAGDTGRHFISSCNYWWKLCSAGFRSWRKWPLLDGMKNKTFPLVLLNSFTFNVLYVFWFFFFFYHWLMNEKKQNGTTFIILYIKKRICKIWTTPIGGLYNLLFHVARISRFSEKMWHIHDI